MIYYPGTEQQPYHQCHLICQVRLQKNSMPSMVIQSYPEYTDEKSVNDVTGDDDGRHHFDDQQD